MAGRSASEIIEHSVSPWLRLVTPIALALIMFILNNLNSNQIETRRDLTKKLDAMRDEVANHGERIRANETRLDMIQRHSPILQTPGG